MLTAGTGHPLGCGDGSNALLTDQRGWYRYVHGHCDIGAYEYPLRTYLPPIVR